MNQKEKEKLLKFTRQTAFAAGKILKDNFNREISIKYKGRIDPVTEADLKSEKYITGQIEKAFPHHRILTEEGTAEGEKSEFTWVIDPLDGTVNYAHRFPVYCVSIGLQYQDRMILGAVYDPHADEMYSAVKGGGAYLNDKKIRVSNTRQLQRALLATGFSYNIKTARKNNLGYFGRMAKKVQAIRRLGSAALDLCWLAAGRLDGFWEFFLHPWDTAAAQVIVEEAGGKVTRMDGSRFSIFDKEILASNGVLHKTLQKALKK